MEKTLVLLLSSARYRKQFFLLQDDDTIEAVYTFHNQFHNNQLSNSSVYLFDFNRKIIKTHWFIESCATKRNAGGVEKNINNVWNVTQLEDLKRRGKSEWKDEVEMREYCLPKAWNVHTIRQYICSDRETQWHFTWLEVRHSQRIEARAFRKRIIHYDSSFRNINEDADQTDPAEVFEQCGAAVATPLVAWGIQHLGHEVEWKLSLSRVLCFCARRAIAFVHLFSNYRMSIVELRGDGFRKFVILLLSPRILSRLAPLRDSGSVKYYKKRNLPSVGDSPGDIDRPGDLLSSQTRHY